MSKRGWGPWSTIKLAALADYLQAFTKASKVAPSTLYLDLFAGADQNFERGTGDVILSSGHRALSTEPEFSRVVLCELQQRTAADLKATLQEQYPNRDLVVLPGDCNIEVPRYLASLPHMWRWGAVFAMVDQYSAEVSWDTLSYLANWRMSKKGYRVELWLYFGHALLPRGLGLGTEPDPEYAKRVDRMYGTTQWRDLWSARHDDALTPEAFRHELVNLMRWRLEKELGYATTIPLEFTNTKGVPIYTVIFATATPAGSAIMGDVFAKHGVELERMRNLAKAERTLNKDSADSLFDQAAIADMLTGSPNREPLLPPIEPMRYDGSATPPTGH